MTDTSNGTSIDTFNTGDVGPANTPGFYNTPKLTGAFGKIGGEVMIWNHFGVGADYDFRFAQGDYAGLNYRPSFYDFYGIFKPIRKSKRVVPELMGGIGGVRLTYSENQSYCNAFSGCSSSNSYLGSSSHFQTKLGAAIAFYATDHVFIKPEVDAHWVDNFFQFGKSWVPEYTLSVGYSFGEH